MVSLYYILPSLGLGRSDKWIAEDHFSCLRTSNTHNLGKEENKNIK